MTNELEHYLKEISKRLKNNFELNFNAMEHDEHFDLVAKHHSINGRTFITPQDIIDRYETFETCYIRHYEIGKGENIRSYFSLMSDIAERINPKKDHFYTDITGVMLCNSVDEHDKDIIRNLKYSKTFLWFLRGFATVRLVCVDMSTANVLTNKQGKEIKSVYEIAPLPGTI